MATQERKDNRKKRKEGDVGYRDASACASKIIG